MTHKHLLCFASGTDTCGNLRSFSIYKLRGETFQIHNDRGHIHSSHASRRVTQRDIKAEIRVVYEVTGIRLEGNVKEGVLASTWPASCNRKAHSPTVLGARFPKRNLKCGARIIFAKQRRGWNGCAPVRKSDGARLSLMERTLNKSLLACFTLSGERPSLPPEQNVSSKFSTRNSGALFLLCWMRSKNKFHGGALAHRLPMI
jgi:hypothetical protein